MLHYSTSTGKKQQSEHAQVATLAKKYLKGRGLKCRAKSSTYSMGTSVRVEVYDQPPWIVKEIEEYCGRFQYGHFNGMEDIYEYSNKQDGPQVKHFFVENQRSDELKQAAWDYMRENFAGADEHPANYKEVPSTARVFDEWFSTITYRLLVGSMGEHSKKFWTSRVPVSAPVVAVAASVEGVKIEEHTHTKKGFQMFIVIMPGRVERDEYLELLSAAKDLDGWYSRKWGKTPAGFAFKDKAKAVEFSGNLSGVEAAPDEPRPAPKKADHSAKLRALAEKLQPQIDNKMGDRMTNTPKRLAQANHSRLEGEKLQRTQAALLALADMHEAGTVPPILARFTTKASIYDLMGTKKEHVPNGYHSYMACTGKPHNTTPEAVALWELLKPETDEQKREKELRRDIEGLQFSNIPGFFPTPPEIAKKMVDFAGVEAGECVLEPSAGTGNIVAEIIDRVDTEILCYETNLTLCGILAKKFPSHRAQVKMEDFLEVTDFQGCYPKIIMNPPFDRGLDIKHIQHAQTFLKPGGRLVALCADGPRQREALQGVATHWESLPPGSFKQAGTGVNVALMVIDN